MDETLHSPEPRATAPRTLPRRTIFAAALIAVG